MRKFIIERELPAIGSASGRKTDRTSRAATTTVRMEKPRCFVGEPRDESRFYGSGTGP